MKKIIVVILMLFVTVHVFGCKLFEPKLFDISLKEGLFQGVSSKNTDLTISPLSIIDNKCITQK